MALDLRRRVDRLGERFPPLGYVVRVQARYNALQGTTTANSITLYGFLALFALTLLAVAVAGILVTKNVDVTHRIVQSLGLEGSAAHTVERTVDNASRSQRFASIVGVASVAVLGTSFTNSISSAYNIAWNVPNRNFLTRRARGAVWLVVLGVLSAISIALTVWVGRVSLPFLPLVIVLALWDNVAIWAFTAWWLPNRRTSWRVMLPAILAGAVAMEVLRVSTGIVVPHLLANASQLWGTLGVVFALLAWLIVFGRVIVYVTVIEVLEAERRGVPTGSGNGRTTPP